MTHKKYTWNELVVFIKTQKDDRMINAQDASTDDIGDVLTHFGRHKLKKVVNSVGLTSINYGRVTKRFMVPETSTDTGLVWKFVEKMIAKDVKNYKQAKAIVDTLEK